MASVIPFTPAPTIEVDADHIDSWDEYFLALALTASRKSKDPRCRVGAVIVQDGQVVSTGYNGLARDVYDDPDLLADAEEKLKAICHAEQNAIWNASRRGVKLDRATIYVTKFPCLRCTNAIIQSGIRVVYTHDDRFWDDDPDDGDHKLKKSFLRQARVDVQAPFHPVYMTKRVVKRVTPVTAVPSATPITRPTEPANDHRPGAVAAAVPAPNLIKERRKGPQRAKSKPVEKMDTKSDDLLLFDGKVRR